MGDHLKEDQKQKVDYALSFLSRDSSSFESTDGHTLQEFSVVVDGLFTCLSSIISRTSQQTFKASDSQERKQAFDSIE